jgi:ABC-type lipoprotein export system ATPase subunit
MSHGGTYGSLRSGRMGGVTTADLVRLDAVTHLRGVTAVLSDVSLTLSPARLAVLAGRSGSGKSTLLHLVAGIMAPSRGDVTVAGRPATAVHDWATVSLLPQRPALAPELTVAENAHLPARLRDREPDPHLLARLGLDALAGRPAHDTSLGEQQRTALARTLVLSPAVALLDEPTAHQDDDHVALVLSALTAAVSSGTLVVVATHDQRIIDLADDLLPLRSGRLLETAG